MRNNSDAPVHFHVEVPSKNVRVYPNYGTIPARGESSVEVRMMGLICAKVLIKTTEGRIILIFLYY